MTDSKVCVDCGQRFPLTDEIKRLIKQGLSINSCLSCVEKRNDAEARRHGYERRIEGYDGKPVYRKMNQKSGGGRQMKSVYCAAGGHNVEVKASKEIDPNRPFRCKDCKQNGTPYPERWPGRVKPPGNDYLTGRVGNNMLKGTKGPRGPKRFF